MQPKYQLTDPYAGATRYFDDTVKPRYVTPEERAPVTAAALKGIKAVEESASLPALAAKYAYEQLPVEQRAMLETAGRMAGNVGQRIAQSEPVQAVGEVLGRVYPNAGKLTNYIGGSPADNPMFNLETGPATAMLPGFFSKLERGLAAAPEQALTSGNAIKQWLSGNAGKYGIKQAEIEATGLGAHLENLGKGKTSKEELLDVVKAGDPGVVESVNTSPKYSQYVLPGGENYREVLLTLPEKEQKIEFLVEHSPESDRPWRVRQSTEPAHMRSFKTEEEARAAAEWWNAQGMVASDRSSIFESPHWDEPNVLAHIRTNDRIGPNGEKQLFVEELQSDWAQKGRKEGFIKDVNLKVVTENGRKKLVDSAGNVVDAQYGDRFKSDQEYIDAFIDAYKNSQGSTIPAVLRAPYVTNTKDWTDLGIKRIMQHAAENGYDQVAFINGAQSADRYDLRNQVNKIVWNENTGTLAAQRSGGDVGTIKHEGVTRDNLADFIGKEPAQKILDTKEHSGWRTIEGDDLQVGGEGMKKFYDEIVPQAAGKFAKQYGAPFGVKPMETGNQFTIDITPSMRQNITEKGMPAFAKGGSVHYADGGLVDRIAKLSRQAQFKVADLAGLGPEVRFATTAPEQYFPKEEQHNQRGDAMRHILLQAQLMQKHGENPAKIISWLHENLALGQGDAEKAMDLYNDELGREIGRTSKSKEEMVNRALQAIESGEAHTLAEGEGGYAEGGPVNTDDDDYGQPFGDEIAKLYQGGLYRKGGEVHKYIVTSLTPVQKRLLKEHHAELGDESSFDDWMSDAGIPAIIHGHATKSMDSFLTPEQREMLDQVNS